MNSLNAVLKFIDLSGMTISSFEKTARLEPGTIEGAKPAKELENIIVLRIIARMGPAFMNMGFDIIDLQQLPGIHNDYVITEKELSHFFFGNR